MEFAIDYRSAMDREAEVGHVLNAGQLSIPTHPAKDQLEGLKTRIRMGAKNVELGFLGAGKGRKDQNTTPGLYGKDERAAMKELAKINKVNLSVHGSISQYGFSGFDDRSYNFSEAKRTKHVDEIKRAVEFAGDTTEGGAVVMHMGEFPRSYWGIEKDGKLLQYPDEARSAQSYLVDKKTGRVIEGFRRDAKYEVPDIDQETGKLKVEKNTETGFLEPKTRPVEFSKYEKIAEDNLKKGITDYKKTNPAYMMFKDRQQEQMAGARAQITRYTSEHEHAKQRLREVEARIKLFETGGPMAKYELPALKQAKEKLEHEVEFTKNYAASGVQNLREAERRLNEDIVPLEQYGREKSAESVADLAKYAHEQSVEKKTAKPIFVAPENVLLEWGYGGHPDELKDIIKDSRKKFVEKYSDKYGKEKAQKLASDHIKATFDVGHANTWRKNFQGTDKEFKDWLLKKVDDLNKENLIGHVHMSDNFGFEDEHGTLGEGKAPIKEFVEKMKKSGFEGTMVAEPSHNDYKALLGAWRVLESPIYRVDHTTRTWGDVEGSYFGRTFSPNYTFKTYLPIGGEKESLNWGGVPME